MDLNSAAAIAGIVSAVASVIGLPLAIKSLRRSTVGPEQPSENRANAATQPKFPTRRVVGEPAAKPTAPPPSHEVSLHVAQTEPRRLTVMAPARDPISPTVPPVAIGRPFRFDGQRYDSPRDLVIAFMAAWDKACDIVAAESELITKWLHEKDPELELNALSSPNAEQRIALLGARYAADIPPMFRGYRVDAVGIVEIAIAAEAGDTQAGPVAVALVDDPAIMRHFAGHACKAGHTKPLCVAGDGCAVIHAAVDLLMRSPQSTAPNHLYSHRPIELAIYLGCLVDTAYFEQVHARLMSTDPAVKAVTWWSHTADKATAEATPRSILAHAQALASVPQAQKELAERASERILIQRAVDVFTFIAAAVLSITVLVPWLIGHFHLRGGYSFVFDDRVVEPARGESSYFMSEWLGGASIILCIAGVIILARPWRHRLPTVWLGIVAAVAAVALYPAAQREWDQAEQAAVLLSENGEYPYNELHRGGCTGTKFAQGPTTWLVMKVGLTDPMKGGCTGVLVYSGWRIVGGFSLADGEVFDYERAFPGKTATASYWAALVRQPQPIQSGSLTPENRFAVVGISLGSPNTPWRYTDPQFERDLHDGHPVGQVEHILIVAGSKALVGIDVRTGTQAWVRACPTGAGRYFGLSHFDSKPTLSCGVGAFFIRADGSIAPTR